MRLGDVVLGRGPSLKGKFVAGATGGRFSHALLWIGGDFIEAMPEGVRSLSFARVPVVDPHKWLLLRPPAALRQFAEQAVIHARRMTFKEHDAEGAFRTMFGPRDRPLPTHLFCSQLVVQAYAQAGLELLSGKSAQAVTPNMLARSAYLVPVELPLISSEAFQPAPYPAELLDRSAAYLASPMHREAEIDRELFRAVKSDLYRSTPRPLGVGRPGNLSEALDHLMLLPLEQSRPIADRLLSEIERLGYFTLLVPQMAEMLPRVSHCLRWQREIPGWEETRQRHTENQNRCIERYNAMGHRLWMRLAAMYALNASAFSALIERAT